MEVDFGGDEDAFVSKTCIDNMEAEAPANTILAMDFEHPNESEDLELTDALQRMALSDKSGEDSWTEVGRYTDMSSVDISQEWSVLQLRKRRVVLQPAPPAGTGASGPDRTVGRKMPIRGRSSPGTWRSS